MIKYNFATKYSSLKIWQKDKYPIKKEKHPINDDELSIILNDLKTKFPLTSSILINNKILYFPSLTIISFFLLIELFAIFPRVNIMRLESNHLKYEDAALQISDINKSLESNFDSLIDYSEIISSNSPTILFGYFLQSNIPENVQLIDYTVDYKGFKMNAMGENIESINQFITNLLTIKFIDRDTVELVRLSNNSAQPSADYNSDVPSFGVNIELNGEWLPTSLEGRIKYNTSSKNQGQVLKLSMFKNILDLYERTVQ